MSRIYGDISDRYVVAQRDITSKAKVAIKTRNVSDGGGSTWVYLERGKVLELIAQLAELAKELE